MANDLTGDYDVVAEFTLGAANRVLAAMHCGGRLPHSWSLQVDDYTHIHIPPGAAKGKSVILSIVDAFGEAVADPYRVAQVAASATGVSASGFINPNVDSPVNAPKPVPHPEVVKAPESEGIHVAGGAGPSPKGHAGVAGVLSPGAMERASHLSGVAQLQMGAPTVSLVDNSDTSVTVHTPVMARYIGDPDTMDIPSLLRGEFQTSIRVQQASSSAGSFINVNLAGKGGNVNFNPAWASPAWSSKPLQLAAINKAALNALLTSFEPSSTKIPDDIPIMNFKTLSTDSGQALAVMMDVPGGVLAGEVLAEALFGIGTGVPDPATVTNVFLNDGDDFALAIRSDDIIGPFTDAVSSAIPRELPGPSWSISIEGPKVLGYTVGSYTVTFYSSITIGDPTVALSGGQIVVSIPVHVHFWNDSSFGVPSPSDLDFTVNQAFDLVLSGGEVSIQLSGAPTFVPSTIPADAQTTATKFIRDAWNNVNAPNNPNSVQSLVHSRLSVDKLQNFLASLMNPPPKPGAEPAITINPQLTYTSYEITDSGIILHGTLTVPPWPKPHIDYAFHTIPSFISGLHFRPAFGEYSALRSWIPGGTIHEYIWNEAGGPPLHDDSNTFLFHEPNPEGLAEVCLKIKGTRISASGPVTNQPVTGSSTSCLWRSHISAQAVGLRAYAGGSAHWPKIALVHKSASGGLELVGHTSPWAQPGERYDSVINLIVHFPEHESLANLDFLSRALKESGRTDTAAAIVVVISPGQLAKVNSAAGIVFADDDKAWAHLLGVKQTPATFVIGTGGDVAWHHHGRLAHHELAAALRKHLSGGGRFSPRLLQSRARIGQPVPNFLLGQARGQELTLRKLVGRPVVLIFWRSSSRPSIETVRDLQKAFADSGNQGPALLAVNDGEPAEVAKKAASENNISLIVVPDPERDIALACGVNLWPTTIFLDAAGLVSNIRYGRFARELAARPSGSEVAAD